MKKFRLVYVTTVTAEIYVEAEDEGAAKLKGDDIICNDDFYTDDMAFNSECDVIEEA